MQRGNRITPADLLKAWEEKARGVYKETLQFVREGLHGLEVMAGKTVEVTKLRLENQAALHHVRSLFTDLGQMVYNLALHQKKNIQQLKQLKLPSDILSFIEQIKKLQISVEENINRLRHLTTVSREEVSGKKTAGRKKTGRGKQGLRKSKRH